jgi:hypothetical protein
LPCSQHDSMRVFLLPISSRRAFVYCDKKFVSPVSVLLKSTSTQAAPNAPPKPWYLDIDQVTNKAATTWTEWEQAKNSTLDWKRRTTTIGNALLRRIPYEEWSLKSFPSLTDKIREKYKSSTDLEPIQVLFPPDIFNESRLMPALKKLATEKQARHRSLMIGSAVGAPLTLPFAAIPV